MQLVDGHAFVQLSVGIRELVVHIEIEDRLSVSELRERVIDLADLREDGHVVIARKNRCENDLRAGSFFATGRDERIESLEDVTHLRFTARTGADVVRAGEDDDDLRVHAIELAILNAPEDVLNAIRAP